MTNLAPPYRSDPLIDAAASRIINFLVGDFDRAIYKNKCKTEKVSLTRLKTIADAMVENLHVVPIDNPKAVPPSANPIEPLNISPDGETKSQGTAFRGM